MHDHRPDFDAIQTSLRILNVAKSTYPAVTFILFVLTFIIYGIKTAPDDGDKVQIHAMLGPGGRPLPTRRKSANQIKAAAAVKDFPPGTKTILRLFQAAVVLTFLVNAGIAIFQILLNRKDDWWPGQSAVVGPCQCSLWCNPS